MGNIRFTKEGFEKLKKNLDKLILFRKDAVADLQKARAMGDLSENGYYKAAKFKLSSIDRDIRIMTSDLKQANIISDVHSNVISIGSKVILSGGKKEQTYNIVGDLEADPKNQKISLLSPLGKALGGKKKGDNVVFQTPSGEITYIISAVF